LHVCLIFRKAFAPDLRVVVMSATLETGGLKDYLEPCRLVEAGGRMFPVEICHRGEAQVGRRGLNRHEGSLGPSGSGSESGGA
jgi:ATP-dependent helicase HrpB